MCAVYYVPICAMLNYSVQSCELNMLYCTWKLQSYWPSVLVESFLNCCTSLFLLNSMTFCCTVCRAFIHRCGRTARMGQHGSSLLLLLPSEISYVQYLQLSQRVVLESLPASHLPTCPDYKDPCYIPEQVKTMASKERCVIQLYPNIATVIRENFVWQIFV